MRVVSNKENSSGTTDPKRNGPSRVERGVGASKPRIGGIGRPGRFHPYSKGRLGSAKRARMASSRKSKTKMIEKGEVNQRSDLANTTHSRLETVDEKSHFFPPYRGIDTAPYPHPYPTLSTSEAEISLGDDGRPIIRIKSVTHHGNRPSPTPAQARITPVPRSSTGQSSGQEQVSFSFTRPPFPPFIYDSALLSHLTNAARVWRGCSCGLG